MTPEEEVELARRLEPSELTVEMRIDKFEDLEPRPAEPMGVYRITGRAFYERQVRKGRTRA